MLVPNDWLRPYTMGNPCLTSCAETQEAESKRIQVQGIADSSKHVPGAHVIMPMHRALLAEPSSAFPASAHAPRLSGCVSAIRHPLRVLTACRATVQVIVARFARIDMHFASAGHQQAAPRVEEH